MTTRRDLLTGLFGSTLLAGPARAAIAATRDDYDDAAARDYLRLVPADKGLTAEKRARLAARGTRPRFRKSAGELDYIGLPVGGVMAGTVYLGGDGQLWAWQILNRDDLGVLPQTVGWHGHEIHSDNGANYISPLHQRSPFEQGFALRLRGAAGKADEVRQLATKGFAEISFEGGYPRGTVDYADPDCPVTVTLTAGAPFVPLDLAASDLPAVVLDYEVQNRSDRPVSGDIVGWTENPAGMDTRAETFTGTSVVTPIDTREMLGVLGQVKPSDPPPIDWARARDNGELALVILRGDGEVFAHDGVAVPDRALAPLLPGVGGRFSLAPGEKARFVFVLTWYFPHRWIGSVYAGRHYATRFDGASAVAAHLARNLPGWWRDTATWSATWDDSTLPRWLMDRAMVTADTLATETCHHWASGRFFAFEGVNAGKGTATHVWHYAQSAPRLFPQFARDLRLRTDYGIAQRADGAIQLRADFDLPGIYPVDGQAGVILETYREHCQSTDSAFLASAWPGAKRAMAWLMSHSTSGDGLFDGSFAQGNTLDADWYGKVPGHNMLFRAALRAAAAMARLMGDGDFARRCDGMFAAGTRPIARLFDGDYFVQLLEPGREDIIGTGRGCYIDQLIGQLWARQLGLGDVVDPALARRALGAIYRYNFVPDIGPFIARFNGGRPYALAGDAGTVMCTWPKGGLRRIWRADGFQGGYFDECMSGFEHALAANLIEHGLLDEGLAVAGAVADRYDAKRRNPYDEIEYSDHYARAMASFSVYLALAGLRYDGPAGRLGFAPRLRPDDFRSAFLGAAGWGSIAQRRATNGHSAEVAVRHGTLLLNALVLESPGPATPRATAKRGGQAVPVVASRSGDEVTIAFDRPLTLAAGDALAVTLS